MWLGPAQMAGSIHPSAWKRNSANFACTEFSEVSTLSLGSSRSWSLVPSSLTASDYNPPSCYVQRGTGDPGGALRGQEQRGQRYVFRRPHPPQRCIDATCRWVSSGIRRCIRSVSTEDGAKQLTRTPCWPTSLATCRENITTPALAAA